MASKADFCKGLYLKKGARKGDREISFKDGRRVACFYAGGRVKNLSCGRQETRVARVVFSQCTQRDTEPQSFIAFDPQGCTFGLFKFIHCCRARWHLSARAMCLFWISPP